MFVARFQRYNKPLPRLKGWVEGLNGNLSSTGAGGWVAKFLTRVTYQRVHIIINIINQQSTLLEGEGSMRSSISCGLK
jgi:hypothetical protein